MVIGFGNSTVSRLRTILEDLNLTLNMAKSGALVNSSRYLHTYTHIIMYPLSYVKDTVVGGSSYGTLPRYT